jgi:hypothetical protein
MSSVRSSFRVLADWYRRRRSNAGLQSSAARSAQSGSSTASMASFLASSSLSRPSCFSTIAVSILNFLEPPRVEFLGPLAHGLADPLGHVGH